MIDLLIFVVGVGLGVGILCSTAWALLTQHDLPLKERIGLGLLAGGIVWGGLNRASGRPFDLGDLLLLTGIVLVLTRYYRSNPKIEASNEHRR